MDLPEELRFEQSAMAPAPSLKIRPGKEGGRVVDRLRADLWFSYDGTVVGWDHPAGDIVQIEKRRVILRDTMAEKKAIARLRQLQFKPRPEWQAIAAHFELNPRHFAAAIRALLMEDWQVEAEGKLYRQPGAFRIEVTSGIDWFELHGNVAFDDQAASLPELLAAMKRGESTVRLGDGTFGVMPEEWLRQYAGLLDLGSAVDGHLRFERTQVGLLDALLTAQPQATSDEVFARARKQLLEFDGVHPADAPPGFTGTLRDYQREGLGWIGFLQRFGFGGCLADDMGLGKTVQVLALLASRSEQRRRQDGKPSLVVAPRSLIFNWKQEAARFTPRLRLLDHTGTGRRGALEGLADHDVVLTTYGTLRRDAPLLTHLEFDYVILDEVQAVKNAGTQSAKAVRLLRADHRLALSGTPIENHVSELWSLFEFLNPRMLGTAAIFRAQWDSQGSMTDDSRALLARALKPFILRRTKSQVAKELPAKLEQTLYCEMDAKQRQLYDEMKEHFRLSLGRRLDQEGLNRSKIQILEALLRLRQASCHPGLLDPKRAGEPSAKLETLMARLEEVLDEGHKALVFSQFVSLLSIVRKRLDGGKITYAYLDGQTRDRASQVERFQNDPDCRLFLISLKAGGLGLNLTAAEYVFLLDPWWNPAVEAQAIDRAHRIGQTRKVFAYRLVTRGTVEEKILELQKSKRDLADAIIQADSSLIRDISREDLELLLS
jgi:SNF2 family DNA or RNA helicase